MVKLELSEQDVVLIGQILGQAPYSTVAKLLANIQLQLDRQNPENQPTPVPVVAGPYVNGQHTDTAPE